MGTVARSDPSMVQVAAGRPWRTLHAPCRLPDRRAAWADRESGTGAEAMTGYGVGPLTTGLCQWPRRRKIRAVASPER